MATSGSSDWTQNRDAIIQQVLEITNKIGVGETPATALVTMVSTHLNSFIKHLHFQHKQKLVWKEEDTVKIFTAASEVTGSDGNIYTCIKSHTSAASNEPVTGTDWTSYWTLKGSTGGTWVTSTSYTSVGDFTDSTDLIGIHSAYLRDENTDTPVEVIGRKEYNELSNKNSFGTPTKLFFDNRLSPKIWLYPQLDDITKILHYTKIMRVEDFDATANTPDFPVHWIRAMVWNVARDIALVGGIEDSLFKKIDNNADRYLFEIINSSHENSGDMFISPNLEG